MSKLPNPETVATPTRVPSLALEKAEKGSHRSMWEILLQLRVLLPYLTHLVPLLDRTLVKGSPDLAGLTQGLAGIETSSRDLETLSRNQALQMARLEEQIARLRADNEQSIERSYKLAEDQKNFRRWMMIMTIVIVVLLGASVGLLSFLAMRA